MTILIVEDDKNARILLTSILSASGYEVIAAANGVQALAAMESCRPCLIISDILMPEMDGYALCKRLKADPRFNTIPFVFYTATYTDPQDRKFALDIGCTDFWLKPMEPDLLQNEIRTLLARTSEETAPAPVLTPEKEKTLDAGHEQILIRKLDKKVKDLDTERQKLHVIENRYQRLVEALQDSYFFFTQGADGRLTNVSPSIETLLGLSADAFCEHYADHVSDHPINISARQYNALGRQGQKQPAYEIELIHANGSLRRFEITEAPLFDHAGQVISIEGIARDITEIKQVEARIRKIHKMEALGTLAGGIAHDFNNILFSILTHAHLITRKIEPTDPIANSVNMIVKAGQRAERLTKQILTYLRKSEEESQPVMIQHMIDEVVDLLKPAIPKTIELHLEIAPSCRPIMADPTQIHQVILNLCTNAYQAIGQNNGVIHIALADQTFDGENRHNIPTGEYLQLMVSDTGSGIQKSDLESIFDPYFTTKGKGEGTGLGLSMVHGIVSGLNGHIHVDTTLGRGTRFFIYFPITRGI